MFSCLVWDRFDLLHILFQIDYVEFERHAAGGSNMHYFDLLIRLKTEQEHLFRNIQRNEYHNLFDFIRLPCDFQVLLLIIGSHVNYYYASLSFQWEGFENHELGRCPNCRWCCGRFAE